MTTTHDRTLRQAYTPLGRFQPTYGYYRQPNGWITVSPMTDMDELRYRREGWEPLRRYGLFEMATGYMADHPLEVLFMRGGAGELCVDQILQQGLYLDPPLVPTCNQPLSQGHRGHSSGCWAGAQRVSFPQLPAGEALGPFACRFCGTPKPTTQARDQHEGVAHKEEKSDIRTGETLAGALVQGLTHAPSPAVEEVADLKRQVAELTMHLGALSQETPHPQRGRPRGS